MFNFNETETANGMIDSGLVGSTDPSERDTMRVEDAQGTPSQSLISPSILEIEETRNRVPLPTTLECRAECRVVKIVRSDYFISS